MARRPPFWAAWPVGLQVWLDRAVEREGSLPAALEAFRVEVARRVAAAAAREDLQPASRIAGAVRGRWFRDPEASGGPELLELDAAFLSPDNQMFGAFGAASVDPRDLTNPEFRWFGRSPAAARARFERATRAALAELAADLASGAALPRPNPPRVRRPWESWPQWLQVWMDQTAERTGRDPRAMLAERAAEFFGQNFECSVLSARSRLVCGESIIRGASKRVEASWPSASRLRIDATTYELSDLWNRMDLGFVLDFDAGVAAVRPEDGYEYLQSVRVVIPDTRLRRLRYARTELLQCARATARSFFESLERELSAPARANPLRRTRRPKRR
jgi:hypothetical protein